MLNCLGQLSFTLRSTISFLTGINLTLILCSCLFNVLYVHSISQSPAVFSLNSKPYGLSYRDWAAKSWQILISVPQTENPSADNTGIRCAEHQQGPVWFLFGTSSGGSAVRTCTIPSGKALFLNIYSGECSTKENPKTAVADLLNCAISGNNNVYGISASIDGVNIPNVERYRVQSPSISVVYPQAGQSLFTVDKGGPAISSADGWYVMLKPLSKGNHIVQFEGHSNPNPTTQSNAFNTKVTYHLTIK